MCGYIGGGGATPLVKSDDMNKLGLDLTPHLNHHGMNERYSFN